MSIEIKYLVLTILITALFWLPYVLDRFKVRGFSGALGNPPDNPTPTSSWAGRMMLAHQNAVENLVLFAPLVLIVEILGINNSITAMAAILYFYARLAHFVIYSIGVPYVRTLCFAAGFAAQISLVLVILGLL